MMRKTPFLPLVGTMAAVGAAAALALGVAATTAFASTPAEEAAQKIWLNLKAGVVPSLPDGGETRFFTGKCVALGATSNPFGSHYALIAMKRSGDQITVSWWVSYDNSDKPSENQYLAYGHDRLERDYVPKRIAAYNEEEGKTKLYVDISQEPRLFYYLAADPALPESKLYIAGAHLGPVYCETELMKF